MLIRKGKIREIVLYPDPRLARAAKEVPEVDGRIAAILSDMLETMYVQKGIGLAAPQIGVAKRMLVVDIYDPEHKPYKMVNPQVVAVSPALAREEEGCLSLPGIHVPVVRPEGVEVVYTDEKGAVRSLKASGILARCIQHEIDHLDGKTFLDRISSLRRQRTLKLYNRPPSEKVGS